MIRKAHVNMFEVKLSHLNMCRFDYNMKSEKRYWGRLQHGITNAASEHFQRACDPNSNAQQSHMTPWMAQG